MSYLKTLIEAARLQLQEHGTFDAATFADTLRNKLGALGGNLRIYDGLKGGIIRGPRDSRKRREYRTNEEPPKVLCRGGSFANRPEVQYFRAVFNARRFSARHAGPDLYMIGYESPLMRKKTDKENPDSPSRGMACDLIALTASGDEIWCIEGKVKPKKGTTDMVYGLLEGFAYGVCVSYCLQNQSTRSALLQEIESCWEEFVPESACPVVDPVEMSSVFSLAAPRDYFAQSLKKEVLRGQVSSLLEEFGAFPAREHTLAPRWGGFLICSLPCDPSRRSETFVPEQVVKEIPACPKGAKETEKYISPEFASENKVSLARDILELDERLSKRV